MAVVSDPVLRRHWHFPLAHIAKGPADPEGRGFRLREGSRFVLEFFLPVLPPLTCTVTERERDRFTLSFEGPLVGEDRFQFAPHAGGTLIVNRLRFDVADPAHPALRPLVRLGKLGLSLHLRALAYAHMHAQLFRLKLLVEKQG